MERQQVAEVEAGAHSDAGQEKLLEAVGRTSGGGTLFSYIDLWRGCLGQFPAAKSEAVDHALRGSRRRGRRLDVPSVPARHWPRALMAEFLRFDALDQADRRHGMRMAMLRRVGGRDPTKRRTPPDRRPTEPCLDACPG
jgi:hypothetical protein